MSSNLPTPDPAVGHAASLAAEEARDGVEANLKSGTVDLSGVFQQVDAEGTKHVVGHMHARAALLALPHIGETKANEILDGLGIKHDEHLDALGSSQRAAIIQAVADHSPTPPAPPAPTPGA